MNILREKSIVKTHNKLSLLPLGSVQAQGWIRDQLLRSKDGMGGHLDELEPDTIANPFINYSAFKRLPFQTEDDDRTHTAGWSGEISGIYWQGLVQLAFTLNDPELIAKATRWVEGVLKHQEADGFLGSYPADEADRMDDYCPHSSNSCYRALLAFYEATGREDVLDAVYRGCLWFCDHWKDHKTDYAGYTIVESMIILYAYTKDERLLQFSVDYMNWLDENSKWTNTPARMLSDKLPYSSIHAVAYGLGAKLPAIIYSANGDERMLKASLNGLEKGLKKVVQPTGGPSSNGEFLSPKGSTNETEYCNYTEWNFSYAWMGQVTGEARWADYMERAAFNGAQGARKKDERAIAYFTSPNQLKATNESCIYGDWSEYGVYAPCYHVACCPTMSVRTVPEFVRSMGMTDENNDLYLFGYGPATVKAPKLDLTMDTMYPFRETVTLKITRSENAMLNLRVPQWCKALRAAVNGKDAALTLSENGFAKLEAVLAAGDTVTLTFPMEIKISRVDDSDAHSKYPIVVERGPLVYALPVKEGWWPYPGRPITPLPEGWSWFNVGHDFPEEVCNSMFDGAIFDYHMNKAPWNRAIDEKLTADQIRVVERENTGYVWEDPPVTLEVPLYKVHAPYTFLTPKMSEAWGSPLKPEGEAFPNTLVPHGCTNLRITFLPRADV